MGQARKRDANEAEIIRALESIGVVCQRLSEAGFPDLLCWHPHEGLRLVEVKSRIGHLTTAQERKLLWWPVCVVRSVDEALRLYGVKV